MYAWSGAMFLTTEVPSTVPSVFQSSTPVRYVFAVKYSEPPTAVRFAGAVSGLCANGLMWSSTSSMRSSLSSSCM